MTKKRLTVKATPQGLVLAQNALKRFGGTQLSLATKLTGLVGRSTIQKFFQGEEIQIDKFKEICEALTLLKELSITRIFLNNCKNHCWQGL